MAHDRVNRVVRDSRGFLWFCTSEGLSRFDGYEFKNYTQNEGLPHRTVMDLLESRNGRLWLATGNGIVLFDPMGAAANSADPNAGEHPMFRPIRPDNLTADRSAWGVEDLVEDRNGTIWIAADDGLYYMSDNGDDSRLTRVDTESWGHVSVNFSSLLEDRTGALWIGAERGLYRLLPDGNIQKLDPNLRIGIGSLIEDSQGRIWAGTNGGESKGLYIFSLTGGSNEVSLENVFDSADGLASDHWMNALYEKSDGRIFVGVGNGLCEFEPSAAAGEKHFHKLFDAGVTSLGEDSGGNLWVGTASAGAIRIAQRGFNSFDETDGLRSRSAASIVTGTDRETYILGGGPTIARFDNGRFTVVSPLKMEAGNWSVNQITFRDHTGEWWVSSGDGLQMYPAVNRLEDLAQTSPKRLYTTNDGLFNNSVFQLFEDSHGDIWISVIGSEDTVNKWERSTDTIRSFSPADGFPAKNCPTAFGEDRAGNIWMGFYSGGLGRFRNGRFEQFSADDGMPPGFVHDIHTDKAGRIWVATSSGGVVRIDDPTAETPSLINLTTSQGLSSNQANCVTEDNFGRIYFGTGRGVDRLDLDTGRIKVFTKADGLRENVITLCEADSHGSLWFATNQGLARYTPVADEQTAPPPVFIGSVRVNGDPARKLSELGEAAVHDLDLASDQRQIQISFFALGFTTGETLRYQYKLDGTGSDWSEPSTQRTVNLNLSPGVYQFLVRAVSADGVLSEQPAAVTFSIARPVWQRGWFLLLLTLVLAAAIYVIYGYRLKRLVELEKVRTRIATDLHDDIGASLSKISILSEVVHQRVPPDSAEINGPLEEIAETSRDLVDSMSDIVWAINPERDHLRDLLQRMRNLAGEMTELADIGLRFSTVGVESESDLAMGADLRRETYLVFKETINNLVKHSGGNMAKIEICIENGDLVVSVADDGRGFDVSAINNGDQSSRGGNGLRNMQRRAVALGGRYEITSGPGKGTTAVLRVPLRSATGRSGLRNFFGRA